MKEENCIVLYLSLPKLHELDGLYSAWSIEGIISIMIVDNAERSDLWSDAPYIATITTGVVKDRRCRKK